MKNNKKQLKNKNIYYLALANLVLRVIAQGLLPLYPLLIKENPISKSTMGYFMAGVYICMFLGTWISGQFVNSGYSPKKMLQFTYIPITIGFIGMGFQSSYLNLFYYSILTGFFNGFNINLSTIILGKFSDQKTIANNFAWISSSSAMATLLGGILVGPILHNIGNPKGFLLFSALIALSSTFSFLIDNPEAIIKRHNEDKKFVYSKSYTLLLLATFLISMLLHFFKISLSLKLKEAGYNISDVSLLSTIGTILVVPLPFVLSYLNKKFTSKILLISTYISTLFAFIIIYFFTQSLLIVLSISCINFMAYCARTPFMALLHKMIEEKYFSKAQTMYGGVSWLAAIFGYLLAGNLLELFGFTITFFIGALIAIIATLILKFGVKCS